MTPDDRIAGYYEALELRATKEYGIAGQARAKGLDVVTEVEIPPATDLADRVEGLVGPKGVAARIRELLAEKGDREKMIFALLKEIVEGKFGEFETQEKKAEQCVRTGLAILTEAVPAGATEGISKTAIKSNPDGSRYLELYFAGPIRSAGATAEAQAVVLADYTRKIMGLQDYRPTETETERYVEETAIYASAIAHLQYTAPDDDIRHIIKHCPVCISGDPTSTIEVSIYKNQPRVDTNCIRGGMCLVVNEGIAQKAPKVLKFSQKHNLGWDWIEAIIKVQKKGDGSNADKIKPNPKYLAELVGGRPIFAYPSRPGGWRLRYGRARNTGINAKAIHPAAMVILDEFPVIGTQIKIERPGKGCVLTPCDTIEPPVVLLRNGDVVRVDSIAKARELKGITREILFLGDILIAHGDFLKSNHPLTPAGFCEEWWQLLMKKNGLEVDPCGVSSGEAVLYARDKRAPLHPRYTYFYNDLAKDEFRSLVQWLAGAEASKMDGLDGKQTLRLTMEVAPEKRSLEKLCVPHKMRDSHVIIEDALPFYETLCIADSDKMLAAIESSATPLEAINKVAPFQVYDKIGTYIGGRMGRPEKAKPRKMSPPPHGIIPVGDYGGKTRYVMKAGEKGKISLETARLVCPACKKPLFSYKCDCGRRAELVSTCVNCGRVTNDKECSCGGKVMPYYRTIVDLGEEVKKAAREMGTTPNAKMKGVIGMTNKTKYFEPMHKGILRAQEGVYVFKDGTVRFDATNLPLTHFKPCELNMTVEKARELGYTHDHKGEKLTDASQMCELKPQDMVVPIDSADYMFHTSMFVDELLEKFYGLPRYYNATKPEDLMGHLVIYLAPHISVGVLGRIIGFTRARGTFAHPYMHTATRRDCDGDENAFMLLLDALLNFSKKYLPSSRGGTMDAPMVLTIKLDPKEVDDQVHEMDIVSSYPLEFYELTLKVASPFDANIETVKQRLGKPNAYHSFGFTHDTKSFDEGPTASAYTTLVTMQDKVDKELELGERIRAVDERDLAERVINSHFIRDLMGNLRSFGQQKTRCVDCNFSYRRPPLSGKCNKCGGKILLTVSKGGIEKYLKVSQNMAEKYNLNDYLKQRLMLIEQDLADIFHEEPEEFKQVSLADFV